MELFGIILSVPFCFVATIVGTYLVRFLIVYLAVPSKVVKFGRLLAMVLVFAAIMNLPISLFVGACEAWRWLGSAYSTESCLVFLLGPPSLVFILATTSEGKTSGYLPLSLALVVVPFCFLLILEQYDRTDKLFGVDNRETTQSACSSPRG